MVLGATLPLLKVSVVAEMDSAAFEGFDMSIFASLASARMILRSVNRSRCPSGLSIDDGLSFPLDDDGPRWALRASNSVVRTTMSALGMPA